MADGYARDCRLHPMQPRIPSSAFCTRPHQRRPGLSSATVRPAQMRAPASRQHLEDSIFQSFIDGQRRGFKAQVSRRDYARRTDGSRTPGPLEPAGYTFVDPAPTEILSLAMGDHHHRRAERAAKTRCGQVNAERSGSRAETSPTTKRQSQLLALWLSTCCV
jgi:hypothetical protein